jgi:histidine triad (HIT) family protein
LVSGVTTLHQLDDCIFCQIARGISPCHLIHEDELTMTFMDVFPVTAGHVLIISKEHFNDIFEARAEVLAKVASNSVAIAAAIKEEVDLDGLGVHQLNRAAAGQTVFHYHMHLIPRIKGDDIGIHSKQFGNSAELAQLAKRLRDTLGR